MLRFTRKCQPHTLREFLECHYPELLDKPFNGLAGLLQTGAAASIDPDDSWSHWD